MLTGSFLSPRSTVVPSFPPPPPSSPVFRHFLQCFVFPNISRSAILFTCNVDWLLPEPPEDSSGPLLPPRLPLQLAEEVQLALDRVVDLLEVLGVLLVQGGDVPLELLAPALQGLAQAAAHQAAVVILNIYIFFYRSWLANGILMLIKKKDGLYIKRCIIFITHERSMQCLSMWKIFA
jgi:hypothetical protein